MEKTKDPIGEMLLRARKERDISLPELAKQLGIPKDRMYKWEQGESSPKYEDRMTIEAWIKDENWKKVPKKEIASKSENQSSIDTLAKAIEIIKQQNAFLQRLVESNLAALSRDVNNNSAAIQAEIRGYGKYQILKQSNWDDQEFAKAMAVVDRIYGEELRIDDGQGNPSK